MGFLGYDLKNQLELLESKNQELLPFPDALLFEPEIRLQWQEDKLRVEATYPEGVYEEILAIEIDFKGKENSYKPNSRTEENAYLLNVEKIRNWIADGEVYELNYCLGYSVEQFDSKPQVAYEWMKRNAAAPFSGFFQAGPFGIVSGSPERFLKRSGDLLISQPIKGTAPRNLSNEYLDAEQAKILRNSEKEQAENLMIVDLVRNDLAKSCMPGTVNVHELFGIYSFPQVHQMISTVVGTKKSEVHFSQSLANAFPMGSMTGAPKIKAMQLIESLEDFKRGPFSGAFGYIDPQGQFDFNVLIRSLFINTDTRQAMFAAGSAITFDANPEQEWHECQLKLKGIRAMLENL